MNLMRTLYPMLRRARVHRICSCSARPCSQATRLLFTQGSRLLYAHATCAMFFGYILGQAPSPRALQNSCTRVPVLPCLPRTQAAS